MPYATPQECDIFRTSISLIQSQTAVERTPAEGSNEIFMSPIWDLECQIKRPDFLLSNKTFQFSAVKKWLHLGFGANFHTLKSSQMSFFELREQLLFMKFSSF